MQIVFYNIINEGINQFVPITKTNKRKRPNQPWLNDNCHKTAKKKYLLYKRYLKSKSGYYLNKYNEKSSELKKLIKRSVRDYEKNISDNSKINVKDFWKYVNSKLKRTTGICNLVKPDGSLTSTDAEKCQLLNDFFVSVLTKENLTNMPNLENKNNGIYLSDIIITSKAIENKLKNLDPYKAPGPDKLPPLLLKQLSTELSIPLAIIFNKSISEGHVPTQWKEAEVTAIFKKGNKNLTNNYIPVSLTSILCKTLESFITDSIQNYMESNKMFNSCQHGFRKHRSCVTQLLEVMNDFTNYIDNKKNIDILYLDFSKAFDTVPHERLLNKLKAYGITNNVHKWIQSFLSNRKQRVRINNSYSDFSPITSGIPQGSILGPVLLIFFINDLPDNVNSKCKIFADDTKIYNSADNSQSIQDDINSLMDWSDIWQLKFNAQKCNVIHIGKSSTVNDYFMGDNNTKINSVEHEKDIGVTFDTKLNFDIHINSVVSKANQLIGLVKRSFQFLDQDMFLKLYKAIIRPHLEYANVIWHPIYKRQQSSIENTQRRATKILSKIKHMSYKDRLIYLNLPSIKYRQLRNDLIQTFKLMHGIDNIDSNNIFSINEYDKTRNSTMKLYKLQSRSLIRSNYFSNRVNNTWNKLNESTKMSKDINTFKRNIDQELEDFIFDF